MKDGAESSLSGCWWWWFVAVVVVVGVIVFGVVVLLLSLIAFEFYVLKDPKQNTPKVPICNTQNVRILSLPGAYKL
jgi:hypothetical protein